MGKNKLGSSWLAAVKRAFRSASKEKQKDYGEEKRREKRTWLFGKPSKPNMEIVRHRAAIYIQAIFRGFLARMALSALKGLVRFQALIRGDNVRKQIKTMQSLLRVQSEMVNRGVIKDGEESRICIQGIDGISILSDEWEEEHWLVEDEEEEEIVTFVR